MSDYETTVAMVRKWSNPHDANVRAAVEMLIEHGHWLRNNDFLEKCARVDRFDGAMWIDWTAADRLLEKHELIGSSGELVLLKIAVALARDAFGGSSLDKINRGLVVRAFRDALGVNPAEAGAL